jgi:hypothetical protein
MTSLGSDNRFSPLFEPKMKESTKARLQRAVIIVPTKRVELCHISFNVGSKGMCAINRVEE